MQMDTNTMKTTVPVLAFAIFCLASQAAQAGSNISFSETYSDTLASNDQANGPIVATHASGTLSITLPLNGFDTAGFDTNTQLAINVAIGSVGQTVSFSGTLGDDPKFKAGSKSATITNQDANGSNYTLKVSWTPSTLTITGTFTSDVFGFRGIYGTPGTSGKTIITTLTTFPWLWATSLLTTPMSL